MFWKKKKKQNKHPKEGEVVAVHMNIFDEEEVYPDCTVQVLRNSVTGETSIGWWCNGEPPTIISEVVDGSEE